MKGFSDHNPIAVAVYFLSVAGIAMFCIDPVILFSSLVGALVFFFWKNGRRDGKTHFYTLALFLGIALINPLVSHNGMTVLFVMNDNPVTLEATVYGIVSAMMVIAVLYWFRSFSQIMTSDKLLYIFGSLSPKLALVLSMALRYVPLFGRQANKVKATQKALGLYNDDNIVDSFKGGVRVFSVMITWALENGIITADSMTARGYGTGKRSRFCVFRFYKADVLLLCTTLSLLVLTLVGVASLEVTYYPAIAVSDITPIGVIGYAAYAMLALLPAIIEGKEAIKWAYLMSKI